MARRLTEFFADNTTRYPYFIGRADIRRENSQGSVFRATTTTPEQTAETLDLFSSGGMFTPSASGFSSSLRLSFDMVRRVESADEDRVMRGVNITFPRDGEERCLIWHHQTEIQVYGPGLRPVIDIFASAGHQWAGVNFVSRVQNRQLKLVV